jgi:hypothetical protein
MGLVLGLASLFGPASALSQQAESDPGAAAPADPAVESTAAKTGPDKHIFGVVPNYRTADDSKPFAPLTSRQKFAIGFKDSFDWPVYFVSRAFAALSQIENQNPSFGQGMEGYAKRYAGSYLDQMGGNMMTESIMPWLLREDPRYFRRVQGSKWSRAGYAASRILVTRTDAGRNRFNFSEVVCNSIATAASNLYYPDTRNVTDNSRKLGIQLATDAFSNILKEFWPDVKRRLFQKRAAGRT